MAKVSVSAYVGKVEEIYQEQPAYQSGGDGSGGVCDCIGMGRGALKRAGATGVHNMRGTNNFVRHVDANLQPLTSASQLQVGDIVLKTRDKDDPNMRLPDQYRVGGSDYSPKWGETNFTHFGTVTSVNPLVITHMTSPSAKKDKSIKGWGWFGQLPWVNYNGGSVDPDPDPDPSGGGDDPVSVEKATTMGAEGTSTVNLRSKKSTSSALVERIPIGEEVTVSNHGDTWCAVTWKGKKGYIMTQFLIFGEYTPGGDDEPIPSGDDEMILVNRSDLIFIQNMIASMLGGVG